MSLVTILLLILILALFAGGNLGFGGVYAGPSNILGVLLVVLLVILVMRAT